MKMHKMFFLFFLFVSCLKEPTEAIEISPSYLLSDSDFKKQYSYEEINRFLNTFPNNKLTKAERKYICSIGDRFVVSQLLILFIMQQETDLVQNGMKDYRYEWRKNRAMGYGLNKAKLVRGKRVYIAEGFTNQVFHATRRLRELYNEFEPGKSMVLKCSNITIYPKNAATHALYRYRPFFYNHPLYNWKGKKVKTVAGNNYMRYYIIYKNKIKEVSQ